MLDNLFHSPLVQLDTLNRIWFSEELPEKEKKSKRSPRTREEIIPHKTLSFLSLWSLCSFC